MIEKINEIFETSLASQYVLSSLIMSLSILEVTREAHDMYKSAASLIYLICCTTIFFVYCVAGQLVTTKVKKGGKF